MSRLTQIRLDAITGSLTAIETAAGSVTAGTPASGVASDLEGVLGHFAGAIKRITGGTSFTSQQQGHFNTDLTLSGANVFIDGNVSFDNDLLYLDQSNSRVGIGTSTPEATLTVSSQGTGNTRGITGLHYDNTTAFSQFKFIGGRARGSVGSPTAVQANDSLVSFNGRGRTDVGWSNTVGGLYVYAKENWTSTNTPTFITLRGVPTGGGTTVSEWVRVDNGTVISTNDLIASGTLKSLFSSGDEGGEIFLSKSSTNTTLTTGVTIDVYQNRLRLYETGGTNRGGYWDLTTFDSSVGTYLGPSGSSSQVQFKDGNGFGGDSGFTYDKTTDSLTVAGNITGSNIAVNGGNITTTSTTLFVGGATTTGSFQGAIAVDGRTTLSAVSEKMVPSVGGTGTVSYDLSLANIFYANNPTGDITANFISVPTSNNRVITPTIILSQSATARIVSAVQIDSSPATINWANGVTPTGNANKQDVFGFSLIRSGSAWKVLGQMTSYG